MCLQIITKGLPCKVGWKVFRVTSEKELCGEFYTARKVRPTNKWLDEVDFRTHRRTRCVGAPNRYERTEYPVGFHVFHTRNGAEAWIRLCHSPRFPLIRKVKVRGATTVGKQVVHGKAYTTTVCKEIFILGGEDVRLEKK